MTDAKAHRAQVIQDLCALVRGVGDDVLVEIAHGDSQAAYGDDKKHLAALRALVEDLDCRIERQSDNHWHPREPIKLISYAVDGHSLAAQCASTALLLISDLEGGGYGYMDYRWEETPGAAWYRALPPVFGEPILAGLDILIREDWEQD